MTEKVQARAGEPRGQVRVLEPSQLVSVVGQRDAQPVEVGVRMRQRHAQLVFHGVIRVSGFDVGDQRGAEYLLAPAHAL